MRCCAMFAVFCRNCRCYIALQVGDMVRSDTTVWSCRCRAARKPTRQYCNLFRRTMESWRDSVCLVRGDVMHHQVWLHRPDKHRFWSPQLGSCFLVLWCFGSMQSTQVSWNPSYLCDFAPPAQRRCIAPPTVSEHIPGAHFCNGRRMAADKDSDLHAQWQLGWLLIVR